MLREAVVQVQLGAVEDATVAMEEFLSLCREVGVWDITHLNSSDHSVIIAMQVERPFDEKQLATLDFIEW